MIQRSSWILLLPLIVVLGACTKNPRIGQYGELSVKEVKSEFLRDKGSFRIETSVSNLVAGKTNEKNRTAHLGWFTNRKSSGKVSIKVGLDDISNGRCASNPTPALTRAGMGAYLDLPNPSKPGQRLFTFTGILKGQNVKGITDGVPYAFYVLMECREVCLVLDEYAPTPDDRMRLLAFHAEPSPGGEENLGIIPGADKIEYLRGGKKWGEAPVPAGASELKNLAFNVGHFIPHCREELVQHISARFSELRGF